MYSYFKSHTVEDCKKKNKPKTVNTFWSVTFGKKIKPVGLKPVLYSAKLSLKYLEVVSLEHTELYNGTVDYLLPKPGSSNFSSDVFPRGA